MTASPNREDPTSCVHYDTSDLIAQTWLQEPGPAAGATTTRSGRFARARRVLGPSRLLPAGVLLLSALINAMIAFQLGVGGMRLGQGQPFLLFAAVSAILAVVMFVRWNRDRRSRRTR